MRLPTTSGVSNGGVGSSIESQSQESLGEGDQGPAA